ncbi:MAG TPA: hypothetical protein VHC69_12955 [Polyangiaceae bacterium]|nr:hypothetical protein [Polyangiaceae bacterium]
MKHSTSPFILPLLACVCAASCGGSRAAPTSPANAPAEEAAPPAAPPSDVSGEAPAANAASAPEPAAPSSTKQDREKSALPEIETWGRQLESALTLSAPDCSTAWSLRDRICDLAQRLCDIAARSAEPEVAERCTDGRARCERATTRVRASCPE